MTIDSPSARERDGSADPLDSGPMAWWRALDGRGKVAFALFWLPETANAELT